jgi:hypothetical protein
MKQTDMIDVWSSMIKLHFNSDLVVFAGLLSDFRRQPLLLMISSIFLNQLMSRRTRSSGATLDDFTH